LQNRILGEWDFVANEQSVNEDNDHGMYCLSVLASNRPGFLVGSAPGASYYLFRTEDANSEYPIEEQYWAAAAERADSLGVDMISSSLGYADFDNSELNHTYAERDGNTTIITRAADLAAKKGILVMNSAGNSGNSNNDLKYVAAPADGDSVVSVGAIDIHGNIASFSSWGPNGNGRLKPDFVSLGLAATISDYNGNPVTNNGTSFANPNLAGLIACLWQAFPEFNNMEIVDAVRRSSSKYESPESRFGYGIPDFKKASELLTQLRVLRNQSSLINTEWMKVFPIPYQPATSVLFRAPATAKASLRLLDASGKTLEVKSVDVIANNLYTFQFANLQHLSRGIYLVQYHDGVNRKTIPIIK
jgi:subtilisin family serine protease